MNAHDSPTVYLSGPITGCKFEEATDWRTQVEAKLMRMNIKVLSPMRYKDERKRAGPDVLDANDARIDGHFIMGRDYYDVIRCDLLLVNLIDCPRVSIGTIFEIAWAYMLQKMVVLVMEPDGNIHDYPFINESASVRVDTMTKAVKLIEEILK